MLDFSSCCFVALRLSHKWNIAHAEGGAKRAEDPGNLRCHLVCADKIVPHSTTIWRKWQKYHELLSYKKKGK